MKKSFIIKDLNDTESLAFKFADLIRNKGAFVCLLGDIGAGKTTFTKFVCNRLNVKEKVTSPSFVILNEYKSGDIPIYHFDLYRLENEGVSTIINELDEYSEGNILTMVEWAQFSEHNIPFDRIDININFINETEREFLFVSKGEKSEEILKGM